jgi:pimeloyl-ACP methyl ester carboxylesterase
LLEAIDRLGVFSFHVVGHSSGGLIALHMALLQPAKVQSIVTMATPWRVPDSVRQMAKQISFEIAPSPVLEALRAWHPGGEEQIGWLLRQQRQMAADPTEMAFADEQLQAITAPTLVVHGDRDASLPVGSAVDLTTRLPQASLLVLPGARHELLTEAGLASQLLILATSGFLGDQTPNPSL